jgi:hypothetical protein
MIRANADPTYPFVKTVLDRAGIRPSEVLVDDEGRLVNKEEIKSRLRPHYWELYDETLGALAGQCRIAGIPLALVIVPRVGKSDAPAARAGPVARLKAIAQHHALPVYDLTATFDPYDPASLEIAAWDDHPNALGHHRLFLALARAVVKDEERYRWLFPAQGSQPSQAFSATSADTHESRQTDTVSVGVD